MSKILDIMEASADLSRTIGNVEAALRQSGWRYSHHEGRTQVFMRKGAQPFEDELGLKLDKLGFARKEIAESSDPAFEHPQFGLVMVNNSIGTVTYTRP